jgi:ribonuclease PH
MTPEKKMTRHDGRSADQLRPIGIELGVQRNPEGSVIYRSGDSAILIAASVHESVPDFLKGSHGGWVTAEYAMHPRSNPSRKHRDGRRGRLDGRSQEIQRLIGRSLRAAVNLEKLGERTIYIDCDVLDADGGTRTASICGGYIALAMAIDNLRRRGLVGDGVLRGPVAAISVGLVDDQPLLDLCYVEDRDAQVDLNVVGTEDGAIVEVQGTAEGEPIPRAQIDTLLDMALASMRDLASQQRAALAEADVPLDRLLGK